MKEHDATEVAYKNGYDQGKFDATEHVRVKLTELYDDISYAIISYNYPIIKNIQQRIKNILNNL